ncbi:MAG: hypothetical protein HY822_18260 [Acidobacteria bacterium]|nr:hypothetical protein [Acidobacteriota bacterium]
MNDLDLRTLRRQNQFWSARRATQQGALLTKLEFYAAYYRLALGNKVRTWEYDAFRRERFDGLMGVRCKIPGSPWMRYDLRRTAALRYVDRLVQRHGARHDWFQFSECAPDERVTLQGEVRRSARHLDLYATLHSGQRMRQALAGPSVFSVHGLAAAALLRTYMEPPALDSLWALWERYPGAVVEFSCYAVAVGVLGWNTLIWEVRDY